MAKKPINCHDWLLASYGDFSSEVPDPQAAAVLAVGLVVAEQLEELLRELKTLREAED